MTTMMMCLDLTFRNPVMRAHYNNVKKITYNILLITQHLYILLAPPVAGLPTGGAGDRRRAHGCPPKRRRTRTGPPPPPSPVFRGFRVVRIHSRPSAPVTPVPPRVPVRRHRAPLRPTTAAAAPQ